MLDSCFAINGFNLGSSSREVDTADWMNGMGVTMCGPFSVSYLP